MHYLKTILLDNKLYIIKDSYFTIIYILIIRTTIFYVPFIILFITLFNVRNYVKRIINGEFCIAQLYYNINNYKINRLIIFCYLCIIIISFLNFI